jgi:hypothetical protein
MPVPSGELTRIALIGELYGSRMQFSFHVVNSSTLTDVQWRTGVQSCGSNFGNLMRQWMSVDFHFLQVIGSGMNFKVPRPVVYAAGGTVGDVPEPAVARHAYAAVSFTGGLVTDAKQYRRVMRLPGVPRDQVLRESIGRTWVESLENDLRLLMLGQDPTFGDPLPVGFSLTIPHLDKELVPPRYVAKTPRQVFVNGSLKTLGSRAYVN